MKYSNFKRSTDIERVIDINSLEIYHSPNNKRINLVRDNRSFQDDEGYWQVYPIGFNESQVYIVCPHCGEIHLHGRGGKPDYQYEGHRASHCIDNQNNGYVILQQKS